ncbi:MAG: hypothetical protein HY438_00480 [DPANN group archaeon]|nr:hypothetical protein [DPANN group archaeon]
MKKLSIVRREIITLEEAGLLFLGILFGWLAGQGAPIILLGIPIALFALWAMHFVMTGNA